MVRYPSVRLSVRPRVSTGLQDAGAAAPGARASWISGSLARSIARSRGVPESGERMGRDVGGFEAAWANHRPHGSSPGLPDFGPRRFGGGERSASATALGRLHIQTGPGARLGSERAPWNHTPQALRPCPARHHPLTAVRVPWGLHGDSPRFTKQSRQQAWGWGPPGGRRGGSWGRVASPPHPRGSDKAPAAAHRAPHSTGSPRLPRAQLGWTPELLLAPGLRCGWLWGSLEFASVPLGGPWGSGGRVSSPEFILPVSDNSFLQPS